MINKLINSWCNQLMNKNKSIINPACQNVFWELINWFSE